MIAIELQSLKYINLLTRSKRVTILEPFDNDGNNALDYAAMVGNIKVFRMLITTLIERLNISTWDGIVRNKILSKKSINKWIILAKDYGHIGFVGYVINLERKALNESSFSGLYTLINDVNDKLEINQKNTAFQDLTKVTKAARFLYDNCDKSALNKLAKTINEGIMSQQVGFDDSLLILSKMVNNDQFIHCIEKTCTDCWGLTGQSRPNSRSRNNNDKGDEKDQSGSGEETKKKCYFDEHLLNSRIWAMPVKDTSDIAAISVGGDDSDDEDSSDSDDDGNNLFGGMNMNNQNRNKKKRKVINTLYDKLRQGIVEKKFGEQRDWIKTKSIVHKQRFNVDWVNVAKYQLSANVEKKGKDCIEKPIVLSDFNGNEFPFDVVNNYNGKFEYEKEGYLTKLIINARQLDPLFQKECATLFQSKEFGIECTFESLTPKTKEECQNEWKFDPNVPSHKGYNSGVITDMIRCRVCLFSLFLFLFFVCVCGWFYFD